MSSWFTKQFPFSKYAAKVVEWNHVGYGNHDKSIEAQFALIEEEGGTELSEAYKKQDKVAFLDAVIDTFVVATYYDFLVNERTTYDVDFMRSVKQLGGITDLSYLVRQLQCHIAHGGATGILHCTFAIMNIIDADVEGALEEVLRSNWSKFVQYSPRDDEYYDIECARIMLEGRYKGVAWSLREGYTVFQDSAGKILKPSFSFSEPELEQFINWGKLDG